MVYENDLIGSGTMNATQTIQGLTLLNFGRERCRPSQQGVLLHDAFSLHIITKGKGFVTIETDTYPLTVGDSFCLEEGQMARYQIDAENPLTYLWIDLSGFLSLSVCLKANYSCLNPIVKIQQSDKLELLMQSMLQMKGHVFADELEKRGLFFHFLSQVMRSRVWRGKEEQSRIGKAALYAQETYAYIQYNFARPLQIHRIADTLGISRNYLCHCFKHMYGVSPKAFLIQTRMDYAIGLLANKKMSLVDICQYVGYSDSITFSKAFKRVYAMSPSFFRQHMMERTKGDAIRSVT